MAKQIGPSVGGATNGAANATTPSATNAPSNVTIPSAAVPATPPAATAAEGKEKKKRKSTARKLVYHPAIFDEKGVERPIDSPPKDWDERKHKPLRKRDLKDEVVWYTWMADFHEKKQKHFRGMAETAKKIGNPEARKQAKELARTMSRIVELQKLLQAEGNMSADDINKMLSDAGLQVTVPATAPEATAENSTTDAK